MLFTAVPNPNYEVKEWQTALSGLITVKPLPLSYFEEGGVRYRVTDKTNHLFGTLLLY